MLIQNLEAQQAVGFCLFARYYGGVRNTQHYDSDTDNWVWLNFGLEEGKAARQHETRHIDSG